MLLLEFVFYNAVMLYAMACLVSAWSWGRRRGIPDGLLGLCTVALPLAAWLFGTFYSWVSLLTPVSLYWLWSRTNRREAEEARAYSSADLNQRGAVARRLAQAPDDGAAHLQLAGLMEKSRCWSEALEHYEAANRASERMFNRTELDEARERIEEAMRTPASAPFEGMRRELSPLDWAAMGLAALHGFFNPPHAAAAISAVLFAAWLRGGRDGRPSSALA
jgi:hypothetical protein